MPRMVDTYLQFVVFFDEIVRRWRGRFTARAQVRPLLFQRFQFTLECPCAPLIVVTLLFQCRPLIQQLERNCGCTDCHHGDGNVTKLVPQALERNDLAYLHVCASLPPSPV